MRKEIMPTEHRKPVPSSLIPLPFLALGLTLACDPGTTRPDVVPFPESRQIEVILDRPQAITRLREALVADSFPILHFEARDAWLDGPWMDRRTLRPVSAGALGPDVVRLRAWAEPARPGNSFLIVELAWRPVADPSVPPRSLERSLPASDSLAVRVQATLKGIDDRFGFHAGGAPTTAGAEQGQKAHGGRPE